MKHISVIIPFYQKEAGLLAKALRSIEKQTVADGWSVEVIVVDDQSPVPAADEVAGFRPSDLAVRVVRQPNGGAGAARNRGLDEAGDATLVAFLDSDDAWPEDHLARAVAAAEAGCDIYFCDNRREGFHDAYLDERAPLTAALVRTAPRGPGGVHLDAQDLFGLVVREFPTQLSTLAYRRAIAPGLRFESSLRNAGEDVLFVAALVQAAGRVCFGEGSAVTCGAGVNVFFSNLDWNNPALLAIKHDQIRCELIARRVDGLSPAARQHLEASLQEHRVEFATLLLKALHARRPDALPSARSIIAADPSAVVWLPARIGQVAFRALWRKVAA
ncbi:glycosyltransferase family 2 protein [Chthonobacter rhizosphaerae]|uniref:glycosyltransferase family 2 protein n=1 Tax=Chthonobacter rhizosphaerae TaxID=2735553 RepID=UPI0015EE5309|nr:glycosyltransferase [Chthonobacter rhizosphaerae]